MYNKGLSQIYIILVIVFIFRQTCYSQTKKYLNQNEIMPILETCFDAFKAHYIFPEAVPEIERFISDKIKEGQYSKIENLLDLTKQMRNDFRQVTKDNHIWIDVIENLLITDRPVSIKEIINEKRKNNFGFIEFKMFDERLAYLRIDGFHDIEYAKETAIHAMGMLFNSKFIVLDLRYNHGGHANMVNFISSYFFKERTQLNSLYFRESDSLVESWTDPLVSGEKLLEQEVFILTSKNTASAAESFAYTMKYYNRATLIGETTRGAANWKETYKFPSKGVFAEIPVARPINPVTKKGWEGEGVKPDIEISENEAFEKAIKLVLDNK